MHFTAAEKKALRKADLAVFRDRVIFKAQPPIEKATLQKIAKHCDGPIPEELIELWQTAFGGSLDYDLRVRFGEHEAQLSFSELFFPGSDGYRDLWGWIEHAEELAEEELGKKWNGKLPYLPFGGFEYLERVYVRTSSGKRHGEVVVWQQGLPPAWTFSTHQDSQATLAKGVNALFDSLRLESDPWTTDPEKFPRGLEMLEAIKALEGKGGKSAAEKLHELIRASILDWRSAVKDGSVAEDERLRRLALESAADTDDFKLMSRLKALGCDLQESISGGASALDHALSRGSLRVSRLLLDSSVSVKNALRNASDSVDATLAQELLKRGAEIDRQTILNAANRGEPGVAELLIGVKSLKLDWAELAEDARRQAKDAEDTARRIDSGSLATNFTAASERERAARLIALAKAAERKRK